MAKHKRRSRRNRQRQFQPQRPQAQAPAPTLEMPTLVMDAPELPDPRTPIDYDDYETWRLRAMRGLAGDPIMGFISHRSPQDPFYEDHLREKFEFEKKREADAEWANNLCRTAIKRAVQIWGGALAITIPLHMIGALTIDVPVIVAACGWGIPFLTLLSYNSGPDGPGALNE